MADDKKITTNEETDAEKTDKAPASQKKDTTKPDIKANRAPYPSQEEADAIKSAAASGAAPYKTRDMKA